jgi:predicted Zn-dependent protease
VTKIMFKRLLTLPFVLVAATAGAFSLVSVQDEVAIGRQAQTQVRRQVPELGDSVTNRYIDSIGRRLAAHAGGPRYPYDFSVANYREVNAFALPGGPVWVHRGAIQLATRESQLVAVMAHEVAHVARRHAANQLTKAMIANGALGLLGAALGNDGGGARSARMAAGLFANGLFMKFSRDHEREADQVGATIMSRAGWDPRGMLEFMQLLRQQQGRDPNSVQVFLSTHPAPADRIQRLQNVSGRGRGRSNSTQFVEVKRRLSRLAPARPMPR